MFWELGLGVLSLCCNCVDKVTHAVDQTAEQLLGDRVLPAWLDIIFLHLAPSHTCNRVVVHMNAHSSTGIEPLTTGVYTADLDYLSVASIGH